MADEEEDITIDLRLRDYLSSGASTAAREMNELADETKKASRALLLLDKRADKAAGSLYKLAAATAAVRGAQQQQLSTGLALNKQMGAQIQSSSSLGKVLGNTKKHTLDAAKSNDTLRRSFQRLTSVIKSSTSALAMLAKGLALIGAAGAVGGLAGMAATNILAVAAALTTMLSFAALVPVALGGLVAIAVAGKLAFGGLAEAIKAAASGDAAALEKAVAKLPKSAQEFVKELTPALKLFKGMKEAVQGEFLKALSDDIPKALRNLQPTIRSGLKGIAAEFGTLINGIAEYFTTENGKRMFGRFFEAGSQIVGLFSKNVTPLLEGLGDVIEAVQPAWDRFMGAADGGLKKFAAWMSQIAADGSLERWLNSAFEVAKLLWEVFKDLGGIIRGVLDALGGASEGASSLGALGTALGEVNRWVNSLEGQTALKSFFQSLGEIVTAVMPILATVAGIIGNTLAPAIADIVTGLAPGALAFFEQLGVALELLAPHMGPLAEAFGQILIALSPLLPVIGQVAALFAEHLAAVIPQLVPIITMLADAFSAFLLPALTFLFQILQMVAPYISVFFGIFIQVLTQLAPILQQIGQYFQQYMAAQLARLAEMLPTLLPQLIQLATLLGTFLVQALIMLAPHFPQLLALMFQMSGIAIQLAPLVLQLANAFLRVMVAMQPLSGMFFRVLGILITLATGVMTLASAWIRGWTMMVSGVSGAVSTIGGIINRLIGIASRVAAPFVSAVGSIVGAFHRIGGAVSGAIGSIQNLINKAQSLASIDINPFRFAGGDVAGGQKYTVGEIGKELFVGNDGRTQMIGTNGMDPNWQAPGDGVIIPSFLLNAFKSLERGLDKQADADAGFSARKLAAIAASASQRVVEDHYHVPVTIMGNVSAEVDIERAVNKAIDKARRDEEERR